MEPSWCLPRARIADPSVRADVTLAPPVSPSLLPTGREVEAGVEGSVLHALFRFLSEELLLDFGPADLALWIDLVKQDQFNARNEVVGVVSALETSDP